MRPIEDFEFPEEIEKAYRKARRLEWLTLVFVASAAAALYLTMGASQAMRTNFFDDVISLVPAAAFLVGTAIYIHTVHQLRRAGRRGRTTRTAPTGRLRSPTSPLRSRCVGWACSCWPRRR